MKSALCLLLCGIGLLTFGSAACAQAEIASHACPISRLAGLSTGGAEAVDDADFNKQINAQLQNAPDAANRGLPWRVQLVAPETLGSQGAGGRQCTASRPAQAVVTAPNSWGFVGPMPPRDLVARSLLQSLQNVACYTD